MTAALREAGRVARPGAPVVIQVWGRPENCDLEAMKIAVTPFLPGASGGPRKPPDFWKVGVLEGIAEEAGLTPESTFDTSWAFEYENEETLARVTLAAGGLALVAESVGGTTVRDTIVESLAPYRISGGGYRLTNEWHYLVARA
jgi:hypothetical protein